MCIMTSSSGIIISITYPPSSDGMFEDGSCRESAGARG